jgi:hypothetical protein
MITQQVGERTLQRKRELLALMVNKKTDVIIIQYGEWYEAEGDILGAPVVKEYTRKYSEVTAKNPQVIGSLETMINLDLSLENPQGEVAPTGPVANTNIVVPPTSNETE